MPGERLAKIILRVESMWHSQTLDILLDGVWETFAATENQPGQPGPGGVYFQIATSATLADRYRDLAGNLDSMLLAVRQRIAARNLPYVVSAKRDVTAQLLSTNPVWEFDIEAIVYDARYNLDFRGGTVLSGLLQPWTVVAKLTTIRPVQVAVQMTPATTFTAQDGAITLTASNGTNGVYTYRWTDAASTPARTQLGRGTYTCTVTDSSGAFATVQVVVTSDARLDVLVNTSGNNVTLVPSGGLAPYTYAWAHGPTTANLQNLAVGTYTCTVTDARGATRVVRFTIDPYRFYWSQNPVLLPLDAGAAYRLDPTTKPNLSFLCQVWVEEAYLSDTFVQVGSQLEQPADRQGRTVFDVQALLDAYLQEHLPALNQAVVTRADSLFRRFFLKYGEKFGSPPVAAPLSIQANNYVLLGGLDSQEAAANTWFNSYQAGAKPFLTWEPNDKRVGATQPEYLYFMADSFGLTQFKYWVLRRYSDGATQAVVHQTVANVRRYEVFCLPAGYAQLGLAPDSGPVGSVGPTCVAWDVYVTDAADVRVSETRRYVLDEAYYPKPRFLLYTNSLGGVNTLAVLGEAKRTLEVKTEEADRPQQPGYDPLLGDVLTLSKSGQPTLALSSGPRTRGQVIADQELLLSPRVTLQSADRYWPGRLKLKATVVADEAEGLQALELDYLLLRERRFTPRLPVTPAGRAVAPVAGGEGPQP